jgi:hypothetical protein
VRPAAPPVCLGCCAFTAAAATDCRAQLVGVRGCRKIVREVAAARVVARHMDDGTDWAEGEPPSPKLDVSAIVFDRQLSPPRAPLPSTQPPPRRPPLPRRTPAAGPACVPWLARLPPDMLRAVLQHVATTSPGCCGGAGVVLLRLGLTCRALRDLLLPPEGAPPDSVPAAVHVLWELAARSDFVASCEELLPSSTVSEHSTATPPN